MSEISIPEFSKMVGITSRQIYNLIKEGVLPPQSSRGKLSLKEATPAYMRYLRERTRGNDLTAERTRLTRLKADKVALESENIRKRYLHADEVREGWEALVREIKAALLTIPARIAAKLPHLTPHVIAELDREIREVLASLDAVEMTYTRRA